MVLVTWYSYPCFASWIPSCSPPLVSIRLISHFDTIMPSCHIGISYYLRYVISISSLTYESSHANSIVSLRMFTLHNYLLPCLLYIPCRKFYHLIISFNPMLEKHTISSKINDPSLTSLTGIEGFGTIESSDNSHNLRFYPAFSAPDHSDSKY